MDQWLKQMNFGVYFLTNTCDFCDPVFAVTFYIYIQYIYICMYIQYIYFMICFFDIDIGAS